MDTVDGYVSLHERIDNLPKERGFRERCWHSGWVEFYVPYKRKAGTTKWTHFHDGSELLNPTFVASVTRAVERGADPSADHCLRWATGPSARENGFFYDWGDRSCFLEQTFEWSLCSICVIPHTRHRSVVFTLSGMCKSTAIDTYYHIDNDDIGMITYHGFEGSRISFDTDAGLWILTIMHKPAVLATCNSAFSSLVLGNHEWKITNALKGRYCFEETRG